MPPSAPPPADPLSGRVGHLSIAQQHTLDKFRKELQDEGFFVPERHDDPTLLRFLRARKFDLEKAKLMIIEQEKWRKEFGTDGLAKHFDFPEKEQVNKYYPQYYHKTDKDGRPVYIEHLGRLDIDALYKITTEERLLRRLVSEYELSVNERLPATSAAVGHPVETTCTILDLKNVSIRQFYKVKDYVGKASGIGQNYYPETMGKFYIINAPFMFSTVWSFIKPWLDEVTVAKISILGSDYKPKLLEQISAENLPEELGGTCKCPGGCSLSDAGPWVKADGPVTEPSTVQPPVAA
ncbi:cytosolic factor, phosphatidylinositol/phosphatidylcholine transfer protein [Tulasnella sp. JGI-2019a]|nr:cytosolic factor, phosphatidylinositol/phosphatidylcholine transfer protein [Tulasnella sp. JGI-2019a]KAG9009666.1 cytosolic factor, phosphatidylinositol/phosphatidylcholine transfer protein [Tulasnella sp. JGI-2019a]